MACMLMAELAHAGTVEVCVEKYHGNEHDYAALFSEGPIIVPAGTVFNYAGHAFGPPSDPLDREHMHRADGKGDADQPGNAIATSATVTLSAQKNCATTPGKVVISNDFGWKNGTISDAGRLYYQAYGNIIGGRLDTSFGGGSQFDYAAQSGQLNAVVHGTLNGTTMIR